MNVKKVYEKFIDRYPSYAREILSYEDAGDNAIRFHLRDGKIAYYFPLIADGKYKKKKNNVNVDQIILDKEDVE